MTEAQIQREAQELFGCDVARVAGYSGKLFLIIGFNQHRKDEWTHNGKPVEFDYHDHQVIASGETISKLSESMWEFARIKDLDMVDYLLERSQIRASEVV